MCLLWAGAMSPFGRAVAQPVKPSIHSSRFGYSTSSSSLPIFLSPHSFPKLVSPEAPLMRSVLCDNVPCLRYAIGVFHIRVRNIKQPSKPSESLVLRFFLFDFFSGGFFLPLVATPLRRVDLASHTHRPHTPQTETHMSNCRWRSLNRGAILNGK